MYHSALKICSMYSKIPHHIEDMVNVLIHHTALRIWSIYSKIPHRARDMVNVLYYTTLK